MEGFFEQLYSGVVNYKVNSCCFLVPLKPGILLCGYFNIVLSVILIVGAASNTFAPTFKQVQFSLLEDASTITSVMNLTIELAFNVVLLCGMHREDIPLMKVYTYYGLAAIAKIIIEYSMVIIGISAVYTIVIVFTILYQAYLIFLVRSAIVDLRLQQSTNKNGYIQTTTLNNQPIPSVTNIETNEQNSTPSPPPLSNNVEPSTKEKVDAKVEIVDEKKTDVKFDRVSRGALARLSDKYKVASTENKGSKTDAAKANDTSSGSKDTAVNTVQEAIPSTSKDVKLEAKKSDDSKDIKTITEEKENDEAKDVTPVPKKRGLFRRSKSNK